MKSIHNQIVSIGYDKVSEVYRSDDDNDAKRTRWCRRILELCPNSKTALDIGCGCGIPVCKYFSEHGLQTVGIDISQRQIARAKKLASQATYICNDYLRTDDSQYDIITAFYSIIHIDRTLHKRVFKKIYNQLSESGMAIVTVGHDKWEGYEDNWLGVEGAKMYWSHYAVDTYHELLNTMNFNMILDEFIPEGNSGHHNLWIQKSG
jgi:cyclopropane fatty-acyl-phospholipid synthase-like methyltransferase